jgi:hypothetical protein
VSALILDRADVVEYRFGLCCGALDGDPMSEDSMCVGGRGDFANEPSRFRVINPPSTACMN